MSVSDSNKLSLVQQADSTLKAKLFDTALPAWSWNIDKGLVECNKHFDRFFDASASNLMEFLPLISEDGGEYFLSLAGKSIQNREPFFTDVILQTARGKQKGFIWGCPEIQPEGRACMKVSGVIHADDGNQPLGTLENRLLDQKAELQGLLDTIRSPIWYLDCEGRVKQSNQEAERIIPRFEASGKLFSQVLPDLNACQRYQVELQQVIDSGVALYDTLEQFHIHGQEHWFRVDKVPTKEVSGQVTGAMVTFKDVTTEVSNKRALEESETRYRAFIANSSEAVFCIDMEPPVNTRLPYSEQIQTIEQSGVLVESNSVMAEMFEFQHLDGCLGMRFFQQIGHSFSGDLKDFLTNSYRLQDREVVTSRGNERRYYQMSLMGIVEDGQLVRIWGTARDTTDRRRYLEKLEYQATHDSLTQLPNRSYLYRELEKKLEQGPGKKFALMLMDLDRFKEINDTLGHHVGDELLKMIGPRIELEIAEHNALVARLGGDEFAILLSNIRSNQQAVVLGYRILDAIREPFKLEGLNTEISASIGITVFPDQAEDISTLMRFADVAMYHAKSEKNGVSVYRSSYDRYTPKRLALINDLGKAIREDQLELYYQPKIRINSRECYGFEASIRWNHPEMGFIPPGEFIPLAEVSEVIHPLTLWVVEQAIKQARVWLDRGLNFTVAANLSAQNLLNDQLVDRIAAMLRRYQVPASQLELEITESAIMADPDRALKVLQEINELGITLAIDDFGTGYSSLAYLKRLPVTSLKIDCSFVKDILEDEQDSIIVNSTVNLAHNLGLTVVAEGVEEEEILEHLKLMGADKAQGYHIGKPMAVADVDQWLEKGDLLPNS